MELPEKIAALKDKIDTVEKEVHDFHGLLKQKTPIEEARELHKKVDSIYPKFNEIQKNFEIILKEIEKFEIVIAGFEKNEKRIAAELEAFKKVLDSKMSEINAGFNKIDIGTDEKLGRVISQISEVSKRIATVEARESKDIEGVKIEVAELKNKTALIMESMDEIAEIMKSFATNEQLHKHYAELKMDLATSGGKYDRRLDEISGDISEITSETKNFPKIKDLEDADIVLLRRIKELEARVNHDLNEVVVEFKEFGKIFARKEDVRNLVNEERGDLTDTEQKMEQVSEEFRTRILEIEKNHELTTGRMTEDLAQKFSMMEHLRSELNVVKEQVIITQTAIVELNTFLREQFSK